jgi:hypothetical protein
MACYDMVIRKVGVTLKLLIPSSLMNSNGCNVCYTHSCPSHGSGNVNLR